EPMYSYVRTEHLVMSARDPQSRVKADRGRGALRRRATSPGACRSLVAHSLGRSQYEGATRTSPPRKPVVRSQPTGSREARSRVSRVASRAGPSVFVRLTAGKRPRPPPDP